MSGLEVWKRLLWKELREGWVFVCLAALLPAIVIPLAASKLPAPTDLRMALILKSGSITMLISGVANIAVLSIVVWGARRGQRRRVPDHSLPVGSRTAWFVRFFAPLIVAAGIGALSGVWSSATIGWTHVSFLALIWAGLYAVAFASAFLLSSAGTIWLGLVVGALVACAFTGSLMPNHWGTWKDQTKDIFEAARMCAGVVAGAFAGNTLLGLARINSRSLRLRIGAIGLALAILAAFIVAESQRSTGEAAAGPSDYEDFIPSASSSEVLFLSRIDADTMEVALRDVGLDHKYTRRFPFPTRALGFTSKTQVYLLRQTKGTETVSIVVWNPVANSVRTAATIPAGRDALTRGWFPGFSVAWMLSSLNRRGFVSPSGGYVVAVLPSAGGAGQDLWVTDLKTASSKLVLANTIFGAREVAWSPGRAVIFGSGNAVEVDLAARSARMVVIPGAEGG